MNVIEEAVKLMEYGNERNWYNGDGLRVRAKTFPNGASPVTDDYVWDVGAGLPQILQDSRTQGGTTTTTTYLYGLGLIATTDSAAAASYYLADGLGSTTQLTDASGGVTDTYTYDVFGALRSTTGSTTNPFDFAGQQTDHTANRALQYLRARHYDPALGRFLGRDPAKNGHAYAYGYSVSVNTSDPSGLCGLGSFGDVADCGGALAQCAVSIAQLDCTRLADPLVDLIPEGSVSIFGHAISYQLLATCAQYPTACATAVSTYGFTNSVSRARFSASQNMEGRIEDDGVVHAKEGDAFQHCFWSGLITVVAGAHASERVTAAYEAIGGSNPPAERRYDLFNDRRGREIASSGGIARLWSGC